MRAVTVVVVAAVAHPVALGRDDAGPRRTLGPRRRSAAGSPAVDARSTAASSPAAPRQDTASALESGGSGATSGAALERASEAPAHESGDSAATSRATLERAPAARAHESGPSAATSGVTLGRTPPKHADESGASRERVPAALAHESGDLGAACGAALECTRASGRPTRLRVRARRGELLAPALLAALGLASLLGCGAAALPHGADAASCGSCHAAQHTAWSTTVHAKSAASPVLLALLPRVEAAWGPSARARCVACHAPGFGGDDGIGCVSCHGAVGNRGMANGALVVSLDAPLAGTRVVRNAAHDVAPRGFLRASALCGTCHEVHGPGLLEEPTHAEFSASRFTEGDDCITCHVAADGDRHALVGVDPPWGAPEAEAARAASAATALWAKALALSVTVVDGAAVVRLENAGAGHAVPTGATHLRDAWVDVELTQPDGARVTVPRVLELGARLTRDGHEVPLVTDADTVTPQGLAPGEVRTVRITLPAGAQATAVLSARAVRASALEALGLGARADEVPVLRVATAAAAR